MPSFADRNSGRTGSSIEIVADIATTTTAHVATARDPRTTRTGTGSVSACSDGIFNHRNPIAHAAAMPATVRKGARMPPISYSQPPIVGPTITAALVPDMT